MPVDPRRLLADALVTDPARPFVTFYDDATAERVELSVATYANWVAKSANLLQEELDAAAGTTLAIDLPAHWQGLVLVQAAWELGMTVVAGDADADVRVTGPEGVEAADGPRGGVLAVAMSPLGLGFGTPLPGDALDYGAEVLSRADRFAAWSPVPPDAVLLDDPGGGLRAPELLERAQRVWPLPSGSRLLTDVPAGSPAGVLLPVSLLAAGGSVVLCRHLDRSRLDQRVADERVDVVRLEA